MSEGKSPVILIIVALFMFGIIYFIQTCSVRNDIENVLESKTSTIELELKGITNDNATNVFTIDEPSVSKIEGSIKEILRVENSYTREYVNQIVKNSTDLTTFWLAFLSVFMVVFSLFSIYTNNKTLEKTEAEAEKVIAKLKEKYDKTIDELKEINKEAKASEENAKKSEDKAKASNLFMQGYDAVKEKRYDDGIKYFTEVIGYYSKYIKLELEQKLDLDPIYSYAYNNRGDIYHRLEKYKEAIEDFNKAIDLNPGDSLAYYNKGCAYSLLKKSEEAIVEYSKSIDKNSNYSPAYYNRGIDYRKLEKYDLSIEDFNKAIELDPNYSDSYYNRGYSYYKKGDYEESMDNFEKVPREMIKVGKESVEAIKGMAEKGNERAKILLKKIEAE